MHKFIETQTYGRAGSSSFVQFRCSECGCIKTLGSYSGAVPSFNVRDEIFIDDEPECLNAFYYAAESFMFFTEALTKAFEKAVPPENRYSSFLKWNPDPSPSFYSSESDVFRKIEKDYINNRDNRSLFGSDCDC